MTINGYELEAELNNANSGFSKWGFATKNGNRYFIKELINPVYPVDRESMSAEVFEKRRKFCQEYEDKFSKYFQKINDASRGNLTRIVEFFRCDSKYYIITEKIDGISMTMEEIAALPENDKVLLMKTAAAAFSDLHKAGIVHFDVKPANIIVKRTQRGKLTAKLIDFDSGFVIGDVLESDELGGDLTYLAPETFLGIAGENVAVNEKADIFALGLIYHEYYCGSLPYYDKSSYDYPYEAALDTGTLGISKDKMPEYIFKLVSSMLDPDPTKRPNADEIIEKLDNTQKSVDEALDITYIGVNFGGQRGKSVALYPNCICYCNTSFPSSVPESYFVQKQTSIDEKTFSEITAALKKADLFDIIKPRLDNVSGTVAQGITCTLSNGQTYDFYAGKLYENKFTEICSLLSAYCEFPEPPAHSAPPPPPPVVNGSFFRQAGNL